jgi:hypothetical protein
MDVNKGLAEALQLATAFRDKGVFEGDRSDVDRLCELVIGLDEWMGIGGFPPERWLRNEKEALADRLSDHAEGGIVEVAIFDPNGDCVSHPVQSACMNGPIIQINVNLEEPSGET